jgi:hypothetical protein
MTRRQLREIAIGSHHNMLRFDGFVVYRGAFSSTRADPATVWLDRIMSCRQTTPRYIIRKDIEAARRLRLERTRP